MPIGIIQKFQRELKSMRKILLATTALAAFAGFAPAANAQSLFDYAIL